MASMTIADATALPGARQGAARGTVRRRWMAALVAAAIALAPALHAQGVRDTGTAWESAVEHYARGDRRIAAAILVQVTARDLERSATRAHDAWRIPPGTAPDSEARATVIGRLQVSALMPLDLLLTGGPLSPDTNDALVDASRDAWRRLAAFAGDRGGPHADRVQRFRTWWRLAILQHLVASGRFDLVKREADAARPPDADAQAVATIALLRGIAVETWARLADGTPTGAAAVAMRRVPQASRLGPMILAMEEAASFYRRALELAPGDAEVSLRLGRTELERNRLDEAERLLTPLVRPPCSEPTCGLAALFLGEIREARRQPDLAAGAYATASSVAEVRPPALMAMIQLALRRGNSKGAYELTRQFATPATLALHQPPDAWNQYLTGYLIPNDRILRQLGAEVVR